MAPPWRFARQVLLGRWSMAFASTLILSVSGATLIFGMYSRELKSALGYDQRTLNTLAFFKDLGYNVGIPAGLLNEVAPPWTGLAVGAALNLGGYLMIYLAVAGGRPPPVWLMCVYICAGTNSQSFTNTCTIVTAVRNFPDYGRGMVLGLLKSFVGVSGAIFAQVYLAVYDGGDAKQLVLLIAWLPVVVSALFGYAVRVVPRHGKLNGEATKEGFFHFLYISIALAAYLLVMIVAQRQMHFSHAAHCAAAAGLVLLLFLPLVVVVRQEEYGILKQDQPQSPLTAAGDDPPVVVVVDAKPEPSAASSSSCWKNVLTPPARGEDHTIPQALASADMLLLFAATICGAGATLTAIDNMGQIGQSLGYPASTTNTMVALMSIWNYAGRVASGFGSEALLHLRRLPRPLALAAVLALSGAGSLLVALGAPRSSLPAASLLAGFCCGAMWPLVYAVISELFGLRHYSTLFAVGTAASPVGSYLLNVLVAGRLYDAEAARQHGGTLAGDDKTCVGVECFRKSFLIITGATVVGVAMSLLLAWRTRSFYRGDIYAKFRSQNESKEDARACVGM